MKNAIKVVYVVVRTYKPGTNKKNTQHKSLHTHGIRKTIRTIRYNKRIYKNNK